MRGPELTRDRMAQTILVHAIEFGPQQHCCGCRRSMTFGRTSPCHRSPSCWTIVVCESLTLRVTQSLVVHTAQSVDDANVPGLSTCPNVLTFRRSSSHAARRGMFSIADRRGRLVARPL